MPSPEIRFFTEEIEFSLPHPRKTSRWVKLVADAENASVGALNFIFCNDAYLHDINVRFLKHDTYTDIITFDSSTAPGDIAGDVFISVDRVRENAAKFNVPFDEELHRVIVHGVLHLLGYSDKTVPQRAAMRKKEDAYLSLRGFGNRST